MSECERQTVINGPNGLTLARLALLAPCIALHRAGHPIGASAVFLIAMATDSVDGWLARRLNQRTAFGAYLDPVVDKIVVLAMFYELAWSGLIPMAAAHLFLAREFLHSAIRSTAALQGLAVGANWMGKTKAFFQILVIAGALLAPMLGPAGSAAERNARLWIGAGAWATVALSWIFFFVFAYWNRMVLIGKNSGGR
ncbi:MAG: CDP-diacylglycerol--glycerol-3-phosphate 3-phosphatidyltransferase [candidate division BRC1 bacterium ADurb.BinA364]|nr:MAG: CDP-diacylglycerol--glycerol-3-phosphate 3-phosphatidyltransferase [candidate division BRC1 bacterium ADurb.BinA364]